MNVPSPLFMYKLLFALLFCATFSVVAAEQEETYTDLVPGVGMLEPGNLANLASRGDVRAMNNVGLLWAKGYDGKQSYEEALRWWKQAAERGYTVSMNNIGLAYANGNGVAVDMKQADDTPRGRASAIATCAITSDLLKRLPSCRPSPVAL